MNNNRQQQKTINKRRKTTTTHNKDNKRTTQTLGTHTEDQHARRNYTHRGTTRTEEQQ